MEEARVRIVNVTPKDKRFSVITNKKSDDYQVTMSHVANGVDALNSEIAGFAFVVWGKDGTSVCIQRVKDGSMIPSILVPDFVRNRLLAERIEQWTIETINESR